VAPKTRWRPGELGEEAEASTASGTNGDRTATSGGPDDDVLGEEGVPGAAV
jgi:hypothetical protein